MCIISEKHKEQVNDGWGPPLWKQVFQNEVHNPYRELWRAQWAESGIIILFKITRCLTDSFLIKVSRFCLMKRSDGYHGILVDENRQLNI